MTVPEPDLHQLMTVTEVAAALRVSRATVYRLVHSGALPGNRVGKSVRVARRIVEQFLRDAGAGTPAHFDAEQPTPPPSRHSWRS